MKYIMLETDTGEKLPIIFPEKLVHTHMADFVRRIVMLAHGAQSVSVASAGFVSISECEVHGESESLGGIKSIATDKARIILDGSVSMMPDAFVATTFSRLSKL